MTTPEDETPARIEVPVIPSVIPAAENPLLNWQQEHKTWPEKISYIYEKSSFTDFKFIVGEDKQVFNAHKFVFALTSPEFVNIFYLLDSDMSEIVLPDYTPAVFKHFMDFVYLGDCYMDVDTVPELLKIAKLYSVPLLTDKCDNLLKDWVDPSDVWKIFDLTNDFVLPKCEFNCLRLIAKHFNEVLQEDGFTNIKLGSLRKIVEYEMMSCKEFDLFKAVDNWAENACEKNELEKTPINKRSMVGDLVTKIRFATMDFHEFRICSTGNALLTSQEILEIVTCAPSTTTSITKRMGQIKMLKCVRFSEGRPSTEITLEGNTDFHVTVDQSINLCGFGIYGKKYGPGYDSYGTWNVHFGVSYEGRNLTDCYEYVALYNSRNHHELYFKAPVKLEETKTYKVWVAIKILPENHKNVLATKPRKITNKCKILSDGVLFDITDITSSEAVSLEATEQEQGPIASLLFTH